MAGLAFAVVDRETGDEFELTTVGQDRPTAESRLFLLGFVLGGVRQTPGWQVDEDLRHAKVGVVRYYDELRNAGNQRPELIASFECWIQPGERDALLAWAATQDRPNSFNVDLGQGVRFTVTFASAPDRPEKTVDAETGLERDMTPQEQAFVKRARAMSVSNLSQPTGKVHDAVAGRSAADAATAPTLAELVGLANVECYPNQRYWLLAELVSRYARARKRDPASVQRAKQWAWQLLLEFPAPPAELDRHPMQYERFNPLTPLQTLVKLLREEGHNERADQVASFIPPIARVKR